MTVLLIIGGGIDQLPAYECAHQLGIQTVAVDWNADAPAFKIAHQSYAVSTKDIEAVVAVAKKVKESIGLDGVMTIGSEVSPTVAAVADALSLPGVNSQVALLTTNKCERAERFLQAGVLFPRFAILDSDKPQIHVPYPAVIKPSDNSASRGVRIIENDEELVMAFSEAKNLASDQQVIIEELIPGDQISIEGVVVDGTLHVTAIADRNYSRNDYFYPLMVEDGGEMPTKHSDNVVDRLCTAFATAVSSLEITTGPTKGDLIIAEDGRIYVIEVTSRLSGGGFCSRVVPRVNGINIVETTIQLALGLPVDLITLKPKFSKGMCHRYYFHQEGKITNIQGLEKAKKMPGVVELVINQAFEIGKTLDAVTYANRLFYIITIADDRDTAIKLAEDAMNSVVIDVEPAVNIEVKAVPNSKGTYR